MPSTGFAHWLIVLVESFAALFLLLLALFVVVLLVTWLVDRNQTGNAVLRNFPVIGHFRYWFLHLGEFCDTRGVKFLLNIDVDSQADVDRMVPVALEAGATLVKPPYVTYYNWYQSVLLDPEGNVFRINFMM